MGIRIERKTLVYDSITGMGIEPEHTGITKERLESYTEEHPFPSDPTYSKEDLLSDISSSGVWFLPDNIGEETGDWIVQMLYDLM